MVRKQTDFNHAHTKKQTPGCFFISKTPWTVSSRWWLEQLIHMSLCYLLLISRVFPNIEQLWIAFGTCNDLRYIPIHEIASALCPQMAKGVLFCHAFTGWDVTSYFTNRGKTSAWKTWLAWPEITDICVTLSLPCTVNIPDNIILKRERFVVLMYCRTSGDMHVNTARITLFSQISRNIDNIPPTQTAFDQHIKRSSYQTGHAWDSH